MKDKLDVSERQACRVVGQHRSTQRRLPTPRSDQANLTQTVINLAEKFGRYGYRRITALLNREGWRVSVGRVNRIWRRGVRLGAHEIGANGCTIKGNINAKGRRIYHVPGSASYGATIINERKRARWFCSETSSEA